MTNDSDHSPQAKAFEMVVGLEVIDDHLYANYRAAMTPLLTTYGGGFRYDFKILEVLKNESGHPINRVFTIYFQDRKSRDAFFADPEYLKIRNEFFQTSVKSTTFISEYERF
ncbi:DUF1330 domain-containing protein [Leptospira kmetyi]|uniref:DUF1330 domain-containing protein n=1 Tax=Leptospira kmetyi TaxID=408139 RepID=A0AAD0UR94_9LEPT|nr:DUF1330 domain-containing protein [Leptospira kmetyi]AYV57108.1 DUF1330 domain-containing protein [Leptospira kmetyi]PJZ43226.1 DUF1330 domain-containing protein [Leptospira kmetyi]